MIRNRTLSITLKKIIEYCAQNLDENNNCSIMNLLDSRYTICLVGTLQCWSEHCGTDTASQHIPVF